MSKSSSSSEISAARPEKGDWAAIADTLYDLDLELTQALSPWKAKMQLQKDLEKEVREQYADEDPAAAFEIQGKRGLVIIEAKQNESYIPDTLKPKLIRRLGRKLFTSLWRISQTALKKAGLSDDEVKSYFLMERSGYRPLKVLPLQKKKAA